MLECDNPFWNFSLAVYGAPGVEAECLALQHALHIDVNSLLFCAWVGSAKQLILTEKNLNAIDACVRQWHATAVRPLRAVRQDVKTMPEMEHDAVKDLRKAIADIELRAEQIEQALLFKSARDLAHGAAAAAIGDAVRRNATAFVQRKTLAATAAIADMPSAELLIAAAIAYRA